MITLKFGSTHAIFFRDHSLVHQALVQKGSVFADRPPPTSTFETIDSSDQHTITSAGYGPTWRILRKNLTSEILNPSRIRSYSHAREWVINDLKEQLIKFGCSGEPVQVMDHLRHAMFCLLGFICFGYKLDDEDMRKLEEIQRVGQLSFDRYNILNFYPSVTKILFYKLWREFLQLRKNQEDIFIPLIMARKKANQEKLSKMKEDKEGNDDRFINNLSYVDTLLELQLAHEGNRKLDEGEMASLCIEFLIAGTDTTATALQWVMANLVKYPHVQHKLFMEIKGVVGGNNKEGVKEDDLQKMPYLKAVILEGLRRHPPAHFLLPHSVTSDVIFNDLLVPKKSIVNFMVGEMGLDSKVWEDPLAFKPERFLNRSNEEVDLSGGSKETKMMPFGAGRRVCPGITLAMLHLEYLLANLIYSFEWKAVEGDDVDLSEKQELTIVMKTPLKAHIIPRPT